MAQTSRAHIDQFLARERREIERLRTELGSEVVGRMDRIVLRDLIKERCDAEFRALVGGEEELIRHRVIVTLRSGRIPEERVSLRANRRERRKLVTNRRRLGERAVARLTDSLKESGGEVECTFWLTHSAVMIVGNEELIRIAARDDVASVANTKKQITFTLDVSRVLIGADVVQASGITGADVDVAVLDTGIDATHADLVGVIGSQQDFTGEGVGDLHGHGTHCAAVIGSQGTPYGGIAPGAIVHEYKLMDQFGSTDSVIAVATIQAAVGDGMQVLSNSWGFSHRNGAWTDPDGTCVLCNAADAAMEMGSVFVVAAGNEGNDSCGTYDTRIRCPGIARAPVTVGASDDSDNMADFSSPGPTPDGRDKPDVTAPGVDIVAARSSTGSDMGGGATPVGAFHLEASGTSMACPHVAGVAALMLDTNGLLSANDVKNILMSTAVDIGAAVVEQGAGRVDANAAVAAA